MKEREMMDRLRAVRELREQRSYEAVLHGVANLERAELRAQEAAGAVTAHLQQVAAEQDAALGSLIGQPVPVGNLLRRQAKFEVAVERTEQLRESEGIARAEAGERKAELERARSKHLQEVKRVEKIGSLIAQSKSRMSVQQLASSELSDDEDRGTSASVSGSIA